jgi:membrane-associated protease RseP (regulator of RpoE activity)
MAGWRESPERVPELLGQQMAGIFAISGWEVLDGTMRCKGRLLVDPATALAMLTQRLAPYGYYPVIRSDEEVVVLRARHAPAAREPLPWVNILLLAATLATTVFVGAANRGADPFANPASLWLGLPFALTLLSILGVHELGHYVTARRYGIAVTLPYFIPAPFGLGTFGAFIKMKSPVTDRKALFDVGIAGPIAGLCLALPAIVMGLSWSELVPEAGAGRVGLILGTPPLFSLLQWLTLGSIPDGVDVLLHPVAFAGWIGLFVTALNLLPIGQLDGGHVAYALLGRRHRGAAIVTLLLLLGMGVVYWPGWLFWATLSLALGLRHPPPLDDLTPLDERRKAAGALSLLLLLSLITPSPFRFSTG